MRSRPEIEKALAETARKTGQIVKDNREYRRAADLGEPSEAGRTITVVPPNVSPIRQGQR